MTKNKSQKKLPKRKALSNYRREGSKFIAPMNQLNMVGVSYYKRGLPELIWWDILVDEISLKFSTTLLETMVSFLKEIKPPLLIWGGFISEYIKLSDKNIEALKKHLHRRNLLEPMQNALNDFFRLYPKCPLVRFLDTLPAQRIDIAYLAKFEKRLKELEYKRSKSAVIMQSHAVYAGLVSGKLQVHKDAHLGNLNELKNYPDTDESKKVGASVCAAVNIFIDALVPDFKKDSWALYFWERSYELRPLNLNHLRHELFER